MIIIIKLVKKNILSLINIKNLFLITITFLLVTGYTILQLRGITENIFDLLIILFTGPSFEQKNLMMYLVWYFPIIIYIYIILEFLNREWSYMYKSIFLRVGCVKKLIYSYIITFITFSIIYVILVVTVSSIIGTSLGFTCKAASNILFFYPYTKYSNLINICILSIIWSIMSVIFISIICFFLSVINKNSMYNSFIVCLLFAEPYIGACFNEYFFRLLPAERCILSRHTILNTQIDSYSITASYIYIVTIIIIILFVSNIFIKKTDLN